MGVLELSFSTTRKTRTLLKEFLTFLRVFEEAKELFSAKDIFATVKNLSSTPFANEEIRLHSLIREVCKRY